MAKVTDDEQLDRFCELVEEKIGLHPLPDVSLSDDICWLLIETSLELQGETFNAEVDVNLSEDDVMALYAEVYINSDAADRRAILDDVGDQIDRDGGRLLYEFVVDEAMIEGLMADLRDIHAEVYGG